MPFSWKAVQNRGAVRKITCGHLKPGHGPDDSGVTYDSGNLAPTAGDNDGEIYLAWNAVNRASSYEVECKINTDASAWQAVKTVTASRLTVENLTPGTVFAFRVRAVGSAGRGPWSDQAIRRGAVSRSFATRRVKFVGQ